MKKISRFIIEHPKTFLIINILITLIFLYFTSKLIIKDDIMNYLPDNNPTVSTFNRLGDTFNGNDIGVIIIETDNIFDNKVLKHIDTLIEKIENVNGVTAVTGLTNVMDMEGEGGTLNINRLIDEEPDYTASEMEALKKYVLSKELYKGNLITEDGKYSMMTIKLSSEAEGKKVVNEIRQIVDENNEHKYIHYFTGAPFISNYADTSAKGDLVKFLPTVILLVFLVLLYTFRSLKGTILPLFAVLISTIWTMGMIVVTGRTLSTIGIAIPVILIAIGSAYGIHVMNEYYGIVKDNETKKEKLILGMSHIGTPLLLSALTTVIGFVSLISAELTPIKEFGIFTAFGVFAACITAFTFIPPILVLTNYRPPKSIIKRSNNEGNNNKFANLASLIFSKRKSIIIVVGLIVILSIALIPTLKYDTDYAGAFRPNSEAKIAIDKVNEKFGGSSIYQIDINGDLKSPFVLQKIKEIEEFLKANDVYKPISYADLIEEANETINGVKKIPTTRNQIASLGLFMEGQEQVNDYLTSDYSEGIIMARSVETSSIKMTDINTKIRDYLKTVPRSAYIVNLKEASGKLKSYCQGILINNTVNNLQVLLKNSSQDLTDIFTKKITKLASFSQAAFVKEYRTDVEDFLVDELDEEYLYFPLDNEKASKEALLGVFTNGGGENEIYQALKDLNPQCDPLDLEDAAAMIQEDFEFLYLDYRGEKVSTVAESIQEKSNTSVSIETISAILKDIYSEQIYLQDIPQQFVNDSSVGQEQFSIELSGTPVVYEVVTSKLQTSQLKSLSLSILLVFILLCLQMGNLLEGLMVCTPIVFTILINFGVMAVAKIPLDVATTMIASIAIGTGVDYSIHFSNRFRRESHIQTGMGNILKVTLGKVGKPILSNAFSVALGFFVLVFSSTVTVAYFGGLTALTMVVSCILAIIFLPALFSYENTKKFTKVKDEN